MLLQVRDADSGEVIAYAEAGEEAAAGASPGSLSANFDPGAALLEPDRRQVVGVLAKFGPSLV